MPNPISPARRSWTATLLIALALVLAWALAAPGVSHAQLGANWASRSLPTTPVNLATKQWGAVAYGGGTFVAVSSSCAGGTYCVMTSPDSITWTGVNDTDANNANWNSIAYGTISGTGRFVAVGQCQFGYRCAATSPDGVNWDPMGGVPNQVRTWSVTYGSGTFVAVSKTNVYSLSDRVMTSVNGTDWVGGSAPVVPSGAPSSNPYTLPAWSSVAYGGGRFVAVQSSGSPGLDIVTTMTSPSGATWTPNAETSTSSIWPFTSVAWGGPSGAERFVAVSGVKSSVSKAATSSPPFAGADTTFQDQTPAANNNWSSLAFGGDVFVAVSTATAGTIANRVMTSPDGVTWTARAAAENNDWQGVTYGDGRFVAVASSGTNRVMTTLLVPATPAAPTATAGNASATVTVEPGSGAGDAPVTYLVTASPGGATCTVTVPATSCPITGLTNGTAYTFSATATNAAGTSAASPSSSPVTPTAPSSASGGSSSGGSSTKAATLAVKGVTRSNQAASVTITSRVTVSGAGRVHQTGTRAARTSAWGAQRMTAREHAAVLCRASRKAPRAGTYRVTCKLGAAVRAELTRRSLRVRLTTTFTPTTGTSVARSQVVVLKKIPAATPKVTG